jgi:hypothetical protein
MGQLDGLLHTFPLLKTSSRSLELQVQGFNGHAPFYPGSQAIQTHPILPNLFCSHPIRPLLEYAMASIY